MKNKAEKLLKKTLDNDFGFHMYTCRCTLRAAMTHKERHTKESRDKHHFQKAEPNVP